MAEVLSSIQFQVNSGTEIYSCVADVCEDNILYLRNDKETQDAVAALGEYDVLTAGYEALTKSLRSTLPPPPIPR